MERALELCRDHGGELPEEPARRGERGSSEGAWRDAFLQAPYLRDTMLAAGILSETFETAITWDRFDGFVAGVRERAAAALREVCGAGTLTCRLTHVYPDGAAPYFTLLAPVRRGSELEQWGEVKEAASEAVLAAGGTITHHHAVGPRPPALVRPPAAGRRSRPRCAPARRRSTLGRSSTPACCWIPEQRLGDRPPAAPGSAPRRSLAPARAAVPRSAGPGPGAAPDCRADEVEKGRPLARTGKIALLVGKR